jgi:hypothetical protein
LRQVTVLVWQVSHCAVVGTWAADLPDAILPSWQVEHRLTVEASCAIALVGVHTPTVWQTSQLAVVARCEGGLPGAWLLLWHLAHCPFMSEV